MADEPAYVTAFKNYMQNPASPDLPEMEKEFYGESARAAGILQAAMVELALETALKSILRANLQNKISKRIFGFEGAVGTFSAKVNLGYALPLFGDKTYHDLELIRLVRNEFAHSRKPVKFDTPELREIFKYMQLPDEAIKKTPAGYWQQTDETDLVEATEGNSMKLRFVTSCHTIAFYLLNFASRSDQERLRDAVLP